MRRAPSYRKRAPRCPLPSPPRRPAHPPARASGARRRRGTRRERGECRLREAVDISAV